MGTQNLKKDPHGGPGTKAFNRFFLGHSIISIMEEENLINSINPIYSINPINSIAGENR